MPVNKDSSRPIFGKVSVSYLHGGFNISAIQLTVGGGISRLLATGLSLQEVKTIISDLIIESSELTFTLDGVDFPSSRPLKYLHHALALIQKESKLPEDFKARLTKL